MQKQHHNRSLMDRRGDRDRRQTYSLDYFMDGGTERRKYGERRVSEERRTGWIRVSQWSSVYVGKSD
jgi:hypothetical protein